MTTKAEVETLTAEVKTLVVGNRQITLSVARQLDEVHYEEMEPFGRVRVDKGIVSLIGAHHETGQLVLAELPPNLLRRYEHQGAPIPEPPKKYGIGGGVRFDRNDAVVLWLGGWKYQILRDDCELDKSLGRENRIDVRGQEKWMREEHRRWVTEASKTTELHELPLIVLAGLK